MKTLDLVPVRNSQIARRVGENHVDTPALELVRRLKRRMVGDKWRRTWTATHRRYFIAAVLNAHAENRQQYHDVMNKVMNELEWCYLFNKDGKTPKETVIV